MACMQEAVPKPSLDEVFVKSNPGTKLYIRSFGGFAFEKNILDNAGSLYDALKR